MVTLFKKRRKPEGDYRSADTLPSSPLDTLPFSPPYLSLQLFICGEWAGRIHCLASENIYVSHVKTQEKCKTVVNLKIQSWMLFVLLSPVELRIPYQGNNYLFGDLLQVNQSAPRLADQGCVSNCEAWQQSLTLQWTETLWLYSHIQ